MRFLTETKFDFLKWRWHAITLSVLVIGAGIATILARGGLPLGVDFSGGTVVVVEFAKPTGEDVVRRALGSLAADAVVQRFGDGSGNAILIRLPLDANAEQGADSLAKAADQIQQSLKAANIGDFKPISSDLVGPTIGADLKRKGVAATLTAIGGILVYIGLR